MNSIKKSCGLWDACHNTTVSQAFYWSQTFLLLPGNASVPVHPENTENQTPTSLLYHNSLPVIQMLNPRSIVSRPQTGFFSLTGSNGLILTFLSWSALKITHRNQRLYYHASLTGHIHHSLTLSASGLLWLVGLFEGSDLCPRANTLWEHVRTHVGWVACWDVLLPGVSALERGPVIQRTSWGPPTLL